MEHPLNPILDALGLIAGSGVYPLLWVRAARKAGVRRIAVAAFEKETSPELAKEVDQIEWMRVGQLGRMIGFLAAAKVRQAVMAGQIAPGNLFDLRPDMRALLLLAKLKQRNAESIFGAIAADLSSAGVELINATTFLDELIPGPGLVAGPRLKRRQEEDLAYGFRIAKESSRLDIGQTVLVKSGTVLAVEAFEGTNAAIRRGGALGKGGAVMVKVSKPNQDFRFDVPVIGLQTLETAREAGISVIGVEAGRTLLLERDVLEKAAAEMKITIFGVGE